MVRWLGWELSARMEEVGRGEKKKRVSTMGIDHGVIWKSGQ